MTYVVYFIIYAFCMSIIKKNNDSRHVLPQLP